MQYETTDLGLAAALSSNGHVIDRIDGNAMRKTFVFADKSEVEDEVKAWYEDSLTVHASKYFNEIRNIKSRIYNGGSHDQTNR